MSHMKPKQSLRHQKKSRQMYKLKCLKRIIRYCNKRGTGVEQNLFEMWKKNYEATYVYTNYKATYVHLYTIFTNCDLTYFRSFFIYL